jgi:5-methylthioadenosine/S-adenosylhomocysteine deaminase
VVRRSHIVTPGFVNSHTHASMCLMRGLADDLPLMTWLREHIWPAEARWVSEAFVRAGARLAMAEMIRSGTTSFNDMYFFPDAVAAEAERAGMRATVGLIAIDFPTVWAQQASEYIAKGIEVRDAWRGHPLIGTAWAPHAPYTISDEPLARIGALVHEHDSRLHIHLHETEQEIHQAVSAQGQRPLARLDRLGLVNERLIAVHMTQIEPKEIQLLAETGAHVIHCPESNLKLASGFSPVARLQSAGVNCGLGTDGAASNNDLDMLGEMRTAALLAKGVSGDAAAVPAHQALHMATRGGARALGLDATVGTLETGMAADVVAVDLGRLATQPVYNPISQLVYAACREQVSDVWVAGKRLLADGVLTSIDESQARDEALEWRHRLAELS